MMLHFLLKFIEYPILDPLLLALRLQGRCSSGTLSAGSSLADGALHGLINDGLELLVMVPHHRGGSAGLRFGLATHRVLLLLGRS